MALTVFVVLTVIIVVGVAWGGVALALRQSQQLTVGQTDGVDGGTVAESGAEPSWAIAPAHMRMW